MSEAAVLLVDDDAPIRRMLTRTLTAEGYAVAAVADGGSALAEVERSVPDVIVLDVAMPGMDGLAVTRRLRSKGLPVPILLLTARDALHERVAGLDAGADDYLVKPFAFAELLARVQALIRRATGAAEPTRLSTADLSLDLLTRKVQRGGRALDLRPREFALLEYLMRNTGKVVSKTMILSHVWGYSFDPNTNVVDVLVSRLRDKIDRPFPKKLLQTVRGVGYVLRD
jgi:DNA-binding response OmpR family regulator